jgi:hypothetical protein
MTQDFCLAANEDAGSTNASATANEKNTDRYFFMETTP